MDYTYDIDIYSLSRQNPEMEYQKLMQLMQGVVLPLAPLAMQQGTIPNVTELVKMFAKHLGINNIEDWWSSTVPQQSSINPYAPQQGTPGGSKRPGQMDDRLGGTLASNMANSNGQQSSLAGGQSSPSQK